MIYDIYTDGERERSSIDRERCRVQYSERVREVETRNHYILAIACQTREQIHCMIAEI